MAEKFVKANRVRLVQPAKDISDKTVSDWTANNTKSLVVFPDTGIARADIGKAGELLIAKFAYAYVDTESQTTWERGSLSCEYCDRSFENSQALGSHKSITHKKEMGQK
jgi:hypothetical protein